MTTESDQEKFKDKDVSLREVRCGIAPLVLKSLTWAIYFHIQRNRLEDEQQLPD
ncbi:MAG: hypothetical protein ABJO88_02690 [Parasphingorhabdus sp.]